MKLRHILQVFYGFVLAALLALGPPIAFLMIPAAGFFLLLLPVWSVGVICLLFLGLLIGGRIPHAIGVALLALAGALSPLGKLSMTSASVVAGTIETTRFLLRELNEKCGTGFVPLKKASAKYGLIVLDDIPTNGEQNYAIADTVAVLTGMRVVEISRMGHDFHFYEARETMADHSSSCIGQRDSAQVGVSPRGSQRSIAPLAVDVCLRRTKIADPSRDQTPAIVLRSNRSVAMYCDVTEVVERTQGDNVELGRVHYNSFLQRFYPKLTLPKGIPQDNWLLVLLSEVLQQDLSDKALMRHAVKTKK
jgi:hypothetical protein